MDKQLILGIDFNNILFSSYYGEKLINSSGVNVNAIKGFFFRIQSLKNSLDPDYIIFANDISRERTFRRKLYKPYKAQRKPHDEDIIIQLNYAQQIAALVGYPFINNELYEADDILGMVSKYATDNNMDMIIISSDKDLYQLVTNDICVMSPRTKEIVDANWLYNKYQLTPFQWIELKMLMGDRSDNIPGINGIGEVTALKLLQEYHTIDNLYNHLNALKPNLKDSLLCGRSRLPLIRELVTILTDYNLIKLDSNMLNNTGRYPGEIFNILKSLELYSLYNVMEYSLLVDKQKAA